ncbi:Protein of unknown function [Cotesia congregata]|uniref:Uncharacterized protein n=1 Tax=Cotesia congregata TaxID=51543 RepID=A0A8J2H9U0_COTCN|nr:Protein of unknown function [Cotesia congregata]
MLILLNICKEFYYELKNWPSYLSGLHKASSFVENPRSLSPSAILDSDPESVCDTSNFSVPQGIFVYDSNEEYCESDTLEDSDTELSDDFADSDDDSNDYVEGEMNVYLETTLNDNQNPCIDEARQLSNTIRYPKAVLIRTLLILSIKVKKSLDNETVQLIAGLVDSLSDEPSNCTTSYHFKKIIDSYSFPFEIHHLCPTCGLYIGVQCKTEDESTLRCEKCNIDVPIKKKINVQKTLKEFCSHNHESLLYPIQRKKQCYFAIEDIMDGKLYNLDSSSEDSLSLNFNVDGTPLFKSSQTSITPVLCTINELHPQERKKHVMLVIKIPIGVCDSVERPNLRCSKSFRGEYGCGLCKHPGEEMQKGAGHVRVYPIDAEGNAFGEGLRSHSETAMHAEEREKGIKGRSKLFDIPNYDIIKNLTVDWMHCIALGVCRQFLKLWFDPQYHAKSFYLGRVINDIDYFITSIKPSLDITRTPRKISDRLHLKAHELVIWLLFYSLPSLKRYLPRKYFNHWKSLRSMIAFRKLEECYEHDLTLIQREFLKKSINKKKYSSNSTKIDKIKMIRKGLIQDLPGSHCLALRQIDVRVDDNSDVLYYKRIITNNEVIHSKSYTKVQKRNSYTVLLSNTEVFESDIFIHVEVQQNDRCLALGRYMNKCRNNFFPNVQLKHLIFTKIPDLQEPLAAIDAKLIQQKVTIIHDSADDVHIACIHPNKYELLT